MSAAVVSFFLAVGASAWVYSKLQRSSGNNTRQSAIATGVTGLIIFFVTYLIFSLIF